MDRYFMLQRLLDDLIKLRVEHRNAEEKVHFHLGAGNVEMAKLTSDRITILFKETRVAQKGIEKL